MVGNLRKVLSLSRHRSLAWPGRIEESCGEHLAIFEALRARDSERAEALARHHLMRQLEVLRTLAAADTPDTPAAPDTSLSDPPVAEEPAHERTRQSRARARRTHA
jgi:hypothetical protein